MIHVARTRYVVGFIVASAVAVVLIRLLGCGAGGCGPVAGAGDGGADLANRAPQFSIAGHTARPISPGVTVPLNLRFTNRNGFIVTATRLRVALWKVIAPRANAAHRCTVRDFAVGQAPSTVKIRLAAHRTTSLRRLHLKLAAWPHVTMLDRRVNQNGCKGAFVRLRYTAAGTRTSR